jgi:hypothetical protein
LVQSERAEHPPSCSLVAGVLMTLMDAGNYITKLPEAEHG